MAIRQIIGSAVVSEEVVDIFNAVGLDKPNIGIMDDNFLNDELAFYDAPASNEASVRVLGDETLKKIAQELTEAL